MDSFGIYLSWSRNCRRCPADSSHGTFLYGNRVFLCKKLPKASRLVYRNETLQEALGQLREAARHDDGDEAAYYLHCDCTDGHQLFLHEKCAGGKSLPCGCLDMASLVLFPADKDNQAGGGTGRVER